MARDGSGVHSLPVADYVAGTTIVAADMNSNLQDISDELTNSVAKDGQSTMTGNLKMGDQRITGLGNATARTDGAKVSQIQDGSYIYGTTGGTANAQTLTPSPAITAYVAGMKFRVKIGALLTNTAATTLQVSGIAGPKDVKTQAGDALVGYELRAGLIYELVYDGTNFVLLTETRGGGTWTPAFGFGSGSVTYTTQAGLYQLNGNWCEVTGFIDIATISTPGGAFTLTGLPFTVANQDGAQGALSFVPRTMEIDTPDLQMVGYFIKNTTTAQLGWTRDNADITGTNGGAVVSATILHISGRYRVGS